MSKEPAKEYEVGEVVETPIGALPVLDITPILHGDVTTKWLYHFGEDSDEKFTGEELNPQSDT